MAVSDALFGDFPVQGCEWQWLMPYLVVFLCRVIKMAVADALFCDFPVQGCEWQCLMPCLVVYLCSGEQVAYNNSKQGQLLRSCFLGNR